MLSVYADKKQKQFSAYTLEALSLICLNGLDSYNIGFDIKNVEQQTPTAN